MPSTVVAAPSPLAADTGGAVVEEGGGPVDALIASTLVAMCTEPGVCAPGGGGFLTVAEPGRTPMSVDGSMAMPGLELDAARPIATTTVSMEYGGGITTEVGPGSIAVPGGFAALAAAHQRWGDLPWSVVVETVAGVLDEGFPLPSACRYYLGFSHADVFGIDPASHRALHDTDGHLLRAGEVVHVEGLTDTLRQIAVEGADTFYRGELAARMVADLAARGSRLTARDLASYRADVRPAFSTALGRWAVATTRAAGGAAVTAVLRLLSTADPGDPLGWVEAQRAVYDARSQHYRSGNDPAGVVSALLGLFGAGHLRSGSTVSISVAGDDGTVAAATMSGGYGSGVIPTGTGLWMNNSLGELELNPAGPDGTPPGARLISNMAPTVALGPDRRIAVGSPGAERITSALTIALMLLMDGAGLAEAVEHPRCHVEIDRGTVAHEPGLDLTGSPLQPRPFPSLDMYFGGVTAAEFAAGSVSGHADSRRTGGVCRAERGAPTP